MEVSLRDPKILMKLSKLGSFHQSKLSFLRSFLNEFKDWEYRRDLFNLNQNGYGRAVYSFSKNNRTYSLICFANEIKDEERSDRVIATKWDAAFTLHDGIPTDQDIDRLANEVPKQEVGRLSYKELTLSRANKSFRLFNYVVDCLSNGQQPDVNKLSKVGYLYRTTAVYGSGKFGLADRFRIKNRDEILGPFRLEMMLVYLVRQFTFDQVNHIAKNRNPGLAVQLDPNICRNLGIGNSTGLGIAPFIVNHPELLNNWILARETALKKIRQIEKVSNKDFNIFKDCLIKSLKNVTSWHTESEFQKSKFFKKDKVRNKKIRLAYYSSDFHNHATMYLMANMFELHDKSKFEIYAFSFGPDDNSKIRKRVIKSLPSVSDSSLLTFSRLRASGKYLGILCLLSKASPAIGFSGSIFSFMPNKPHANEAAIAK